ncbi:hypothetical protein C5167_047295 [Papaver somniferum]|uniref:Uncharacterized protein n=1 Tax=Papaver somniferum TaxID=3469 RepID=A0A4Y7LJ55_PAPSO|nr:hypothetical protein C5167_047295 [Papaver somniferum]
MEQVEASTNEELVLRELLPNEPSSPDPCTQEPPREGVQSFCNILTASDTSTDRGFSVLRKHANESLPPWI